MGNSMEGRSKVKWLFHNPSQSQYITSMSLQYQTPWAVFSKKAQLPFRLQKHSVCQESEPVWVMGSLENLALGSQWKLQGAKYYWSSTPYLYTKTGIEYCRHRRTHHQQPTQCSNLWITFFLYCTWKIINSLHLSLF